MKRSQSAPRSDVNAAPIAKVRKEPPPVYIDHDINGESVRFNRCNAPGVTSYYYTDDNKQYFLKLPRDYINYDILHREIYVLKMLQHFPDCFPTLVAHTRTYIILKYIGPTLCASNAPEDISEQLHRIVAILQSYNLRHCDIKNDELLVNNGRIFLVDFGWALYKDSWTFDNRFSGRIKPVFANKPDEEMINTTLQKANINAEIFPKSKQQQLKKHLIRLCAMLEVFAAENIQLTEQFMCLKQKCDQATTTKDITACLRVLLALIS
jgi:hypothetical protein